MAQKSSGAQQGARDTLSKKPREGPTVNDYFKNFQQGEKAKIQINPSVPEGRVHMRYHGRTVEIVGERGEAYRVEFSDQGKTKNLFIKPIHLEKVED